MSSCRFFVRIGSKCVQLFFCRPSPHSQPRTALLVAGHIARASPMRVSSWARVPRRSHARARTTLRPPGRSGVCLRHGCGQPLRVCPPQRAQPAAYAHGRPVASGVGACPRRVTRTSHPSEPRMGGPALGYRTRPHRPRLSVRAWAAGLASVPEQAGGAAKPVGVRKSPWPPLRPPVKGPSRRAPVR